MKKELELLKILPAKGENCGNELREKCLFLDNISSMGEMDEFAVLQSSLYKKIFDKELKSSSRWRKLLSVVKVTYTDGNGKKTSIHRAFRSESCQGFDGSYVALSPHSIRLLSTDGEVKAGAKVTVDKGCWLTFYLFHPDRAVLVSTWFGVIGLCFSLIAFVKDIVDWIAQAFCC